MTITLPDLSGLDLTAIVVLALLCAAVDTVWNIVLALAHKNFSADYVASFLVSHVAMRVGPIAFLAILGNGVPAANVPAIPAVTLAATGALAAYVVETVSSLIAATQNTAPPAA